MKLIIAIVRPSKLDDVKRELNQIEVVRLTVLPCQGFGRTRGAVPGDVAASRSRGGELNLLPKMQLQIAVNDEFVEPTIAAIQAAGRSDDDGEPGDGKIFILPMDDCIRIRTGQRGSEAI
ncbi:MAG: P-II family nitrogen regulator [Planctomycetota bacterium]